MKKSGDLIFLLTLFGLITIVSPLTNTLVHAQNSGADLNLQKKIDTYTATIKNLEQEISNYQKQIDTTSKQASTLNNSIKVLDTSKKQIETSISVTVNKIDKTNLTIQQLADNIAKKQKQIDDNKKAVAESLKKVAETDTDSIIEMMLRYDTLSTVWNDVAEVQTFQDTIHDKSIELATLQKNLEITYADTAEKKKELVNLQKDLTSKKTVVESTTKEKANLLADTKNQEANYKKILKDKIALKNAFEKELNAFEAQLHLNVNLSNIPHTGSGVLSWPLDQIVVTQKFGDTDFSRANPGAYNGNGHNGVDFSAPIGTRVMAAASGVITGTGNTDIACPKASYGKWVLIKHTNGLSTLYAHLSVISVSEGQSVSTGDIIGYSGNTGYSTGPHLHFTVYASQGVQVLDRQSKVCGSVYHMPVADLKAYLNPLLYL